jgi:hypothetical protein
MDSIYTPGRNTPPNDPTAVFTPINYLESQVYSVKDKGAWAGEAEVGCGIGP